MGQVLCTGVGGRTRSFSTHGFFFVIASIGVQPKACIYDVLIFRRGAMVWQDYEQWRYSPPGEHELENMLSLVRTGAANAERGMNAAKIAEMAADAAGIYGQQAVKMAKF